MAFKVGIIGPPTSGKSNVAASLFSEMLKNGYNGTRLVTEAAIEWLGSGNKIETLYDQESITKLQIDKEHTAKMQKFNPIICDSAIFIGQSYLNYRLSKYGKSEEEKKSKTFEVDKRKYLQKLSKTYDEYDMIIYTPIFSNESKVNTFRIHDIEQSKEIDELIKQDIKENVKCPIFKAPSKLELRDGFIKYVAGEIAELTNT